MANKNYTTLSSSTQAGTMFHDRDSLQYTACYPVVEFQATTIKAVDESHTIEKYLVDNFWYQKANSAKRKQMLERICKVNQHIKIVLDFIDTTYGHLGRDCVHISISGSYIYSDTPGDIDLNVVLSGSYFDYVTFNQVIEKLDAVGTVKKVSLTVMGLDNILGKKKIIDNIENTGFMHQDTILREMIVAPMRNVTIYGATFDNSKNVNSRNVLVRVARQLYFASLTLQGKIPYYNEDPLKTKKALSRINEAHEIIEWLLNSDDKII